VYLGYDKRLHRKVAIKIVTLPSNRSACKRLLREAQIVARIDSPKVVRIHDVIESSAHIALIMEYVPGCSLEEFLALVRPSIASILTVGTDVAGALALARQQKIVHGDVKAANVLITETGRAKLTDFGISKLAGKDALPKRVAGSLCALSPEQLLGQPLDERADLFALGVLLYRMLCAEQPFFRDGKFDPELLLKHSPRPMEEVVSGDVEIPKPLVDLVNALLQKDPELRPDNTRRVRQVLRTVLRSLPLSSNHSLLSEAQPCFRAESPEDLPPLIPEELRYQARSTLLPSDTKRARLSLWLKSLRWPARALVVVGLLGAASSPLIVALQHAVTPVRFELPRTFVSAESELPLEVSRTWLVREVKEALRSELGTLQINGPVGADPRITFYSGGAPEPWALTSEQMIRIALRCVEDMCIFAISREQDGASHNQQTALLADMSIEQWRDIVRSTALALYP
jgi:serine/threonine protein kinase